MKEYEAAMKDLEETRWQTNSQLQGNGNLFDFVKDKKFWHYRNRGV